MIFLQKYPKRGIDKWRYQGLSLHHVKREKKKQIDLNVTLQSMVLMVPDEKIIGTES